MMNMSGDRGKFLRLLKNASTALVCAFALSLVTISPVTVRAVAAQAGKSIFSKKLPELTFEILEVSPAQFKIHLSNFQIKKDGTLGDAEVQFVKNPSRLVIDVKGIQLQKNQTFIIGHSIVKGARLGVHPNQVRLVLDLTSESVVSSDAQKRSDNSFAVNFVVSGVTSVNTGVSEAEHLPVTEKATALPTKAPEPSTVPTSKPTHQESNGAIATPVIIATAEERASTATEVVSRIEPPIEENTVVPSATPTHVRPTATTIPATPTPRATNTKQPSPTATFTRTVKPSPTSTPTVKSVEKVVTEEKNAAELPVRKVPEAKGTVKATPLSTATPEPTELPAIEPSPTAEIAHRSGDRDTGDDEKSAPLSSLLEKRAAVGSDAGANVAAVNPSSATENPIGPTDATQYLIDLRFDYQIQNHEPLLRLVMMSGANFNLVKKDSQTYDLVIQKAGIKSKTLAQPHFPPHDFVGFTLVHPKYEKEALTVEIKVDRGTRITAFARGNEIWIRSAAK